jgi:hypothetical protein
MWTGPNAWKYLPELWNEEQMSIYEFQIELPELDNSGDNFFQLRAMDGAGSSFQSKIWRIHVNKELIYPSVMLVSPQDNSVIKGQPAIQLNWTVDFYDPSLATYRLYISNDKSSIGSLDPNVMVDYVAGSTSYTIENLPPDEYFWTVIPISLGENLGSCINGIFSFKVQLDIDIFTLNADIISPVIEIIPGGEPIILNIDVINLRNQELLLEPNVEKNKSIFVEMEYQSNDEGILILQGNSIEQLFLKISASDQVELGSYNLLLNLSHKSGHIKIIEIIIEVIELSDSIDGEDGSIPLLSIFIGLIIFIIFVLTIIIFIILFLKKKSNVDIIEEDNFKKELDELESSLITEVMKENNLNLYPGELPEND